MGLTFSEHHLNLVSLSCLHCISWELVPFQPHVLPLVCWLGYWDLQCIGQVWTFFASGHLSFQVSSRRGMSANKATSRVCYRLWTVLSMLAFLHRGEAVNPGPSECNGVDRQWSIGTFNPSGLGGKQQIINSSLGDCDLWAISETHLSSQSMHSFRQGLKWSRSDCTFCVGGCPVSLRPHSDKVGSWSGVAMLSKHPTRQVPVRWQPLTFESSRVLITSTLCADLWITGGVIYGEPPGIKHPDALQNTNLLAQEVLDHLLQSRGLRFLAGDFNFEKGSLEVFQTLAEAGFRDLQDLALERWGNPIQMTCKRKTRKDYCFISPELQSMLVGVEVDDTIWADHAVLKGRFQGGSQQLVRHFWHVPQHLEWPQDFQFQVTREWVDHSDPSKQNEALWEAAESAANQVRVQRGQPPYHPSCLGRVQFWSIS